MASRDRSTAFWLPLAIGAVAILLLWGLWQENRRVIYRARSRVIEAINHTLGGSKAFHDYALIEDISFRNVSSFWAIPAEMHFRVNLHVKDARHQTAQRMASGVVKGWYDRSLHAVYGTVRMSVGSEAVSEHQFIYGSSEGVKHSAPDPRRPSGRKAGRSPKEPVRRGFEDGSRSARRARRARRA